MGVINGLTTVNGGQIVPFKESMVELLGPRISSHKVPMVVCYAAEGITKVSMVYDGKAFYVYRFRTHSELHHYWSRKFTSSQAYESEKYHNMAVYLVEAYKTFYTQITQV